jgi:hypothetical protein
MEKCEFCAIISKPKLTSLAELSENPHIAYFTSLKAAMELWPLLSLIELSVRNTFSGALVGAFGIEFFQTDLGILTSKHLKRFPWFHHPERASNPNDVISSLTMGFWTDLTGKRYESRIWAPILVKSLQLPSDVSRERFSHRLRHATIIRNRIAHHESISKQRFTNAQSDLEELLLWLSPAASRELEIFNITIALHPVE